MSALVGRDAERAHLDRLLAATRSGRSAVLVLRGPAGVGKTALLDNAVTAAGDHDVVRVRGVAAEADLPYSALHLVCSALTGHHGRLERHHREALETAVGLRAGDTPDRFLVGVALVALVALAAQARPLLCVVDDAQWLDAASAEALAFVARRLGPVPVALVFACRGEGFTGLPDLVVGGLTHAHASDLLRSTLPASMDEAVLARIVVEARGNPLALLDSVRGVTPVELAGGYGVGAAKGTDEAALAGLAPDSWLLLVLAAAEPLGDPVRLWRAAARLGVATRAAEQLEARDLLSFGPRVTFGDPRLRPTVYGLASAAVRRRVHGALAAAIDPAAEPDRHVWHLAHSLVGPDDQVGDELARQAATARDRGGLAAAAAFLERAASCATDPSTRVEREITAADAYHAAGATERAVRLLAVAELGPADPRRRARLDRLRARIAFDTTRDRAAVRQLSLAAGELAVCDQHLARGAYVETLGTAILAGDEETVRVVRAELTGPGDRGTDLLLDGVAQRCADGYVAAVEPLKLALKALDHDGADDRWSHRLACLAAADLWDDDRWHELTNAQLRRVRHEGARTVLPYALTQRALTLIHIGRFAAAQSLVDESGAVTDATGTLAFAHAAVVLAAWRGDEDRTRAVCHEAHRGDEPTAVAMASYATAVLHNGLGAYAEAVAAVRRFADDDGLVITGWSLAELVEAAVRSGALDLAAVAARRLAERAGSSGTEWALGVAARSRALLCDGPAAEDLYVEAIDRLGRSRIRTHLARARLVYGEWLRRQGRRADARVPLRAAHQSFAEMGALAFADRAERELLATGERARRRVEETRGELTPQERRIASLARDGRSNPAIATLLSISPRTVEYHLHKVFTKLGITSRTELHLVLPA